jgi:hypothetical protein
MRWRICCPSDCCADIVWRLRRVVRSGRERGRERGETEEGEKRRFGVAARWDEACAFWSVREDRAQRWPSISFLSSSFFVFRRRCRRLEKTELRRRCPSLSCYTDIPVSRRPSQCLCPPKWSFSCSSLKERKVSFNERRREKRETTRKTHLDLLRRALRRLRTVSARLGHFVGSGLTVTFGGLRFDG